MAALLDPGAAPSATAPEARGGAPCPRRLELRVVGGEEVAAVGVLQHVVQEVPGARRERRLEAGLTRGTDRRRRQPGPGAGVVRAVGLQISDGQRSEEHTYELQSRQY